LSEDERKVLLSKIVKRGNGYVLLWGGEVESKAKIICCEEIT
jgi:hypothetical protein